MIRAFAAALLCLSLPSQALALSCAQWSATDTYRAAAEAGERYVIALGSFFRLSPEQGTGSAGAVPYSYIAHFAGDVASRVGFRTPMESPVRIDVSCVAGWCGTPPEDGQTVLAFLQVDDNRDYSLSVEACPFWMVANPDRDAVDQITACMRNGC